MFPPNSKVNHSKYGNGIVVTDMGNSVVVRFDKTVEICSPADLVKEPDAIEDLQNKRFVSEQELAVAISAKCIKSVNDQWGVFARTKIELLPHQLWVCRQARQKQPCRLLVADDVGLGKTIEAGIILSAFMTTGRIHRLLILTPASLVEQWQYRMLSMFDIRLTRYLTELDTAESGFWKSASMVVASLDTLRLDRNERQDRLFNADPWDLVIVDEAHHLNCDERSGPTLGYNFIRAMEEHNLIDSLIFFTGTPHKGKNFSFLSLMKLLDDETFSPKTDLGDQLAPLKNYMIRNNKYNVTDLQGNRLFFEPSVLSTTYSYSPEEQLFYDTLTNFISSGMAYANSLSQGASRAVMFVLITMQKLASSSVAAIRHAMQKRIEKKDLAEAREKQLEQQLNILEDMDDESLDDRRAQIEEELLEISRFIDISENERPAIQKLLDLANDVNPETKIQSILDVLRTDYSDEQVLFFTEYKATQSALMSALMKEYGEESVTFINGDEALDGVLLPNGTSKNLKIKRQNASALFNEGQRRFLIATEAAGEGIDLQKNCHILFHVDLPWNPMRLHQRVGRLNRYGQKQKVIVRNFRNPDTVESRIWSKLNEKIQYINQTFSSVMEQKEDLFQLVLGMTPQGVFNELFACAPQGKDDEKLSQWFNAKTAQIGGKDVFEAVKVIAGNAEKYDYHSVSNLLPHTDLPDLQPFWESLLAIKGRRVMNHDGAFDFITPEEWLGFGVFKKYTDMTFSRTPQKGQTILGIGHTVFDKGLADALKSTARVAVSASVDHHLLVYSVIDQLTDQTHEKIKLILGCSIDKNGDFIKVIQDWELLKIMNTLPHRAASINSIPFSEDKLLNIKQRCETALIDFLKQKEKNIHIPVFSLEAVLFSVKE